MDAHVVAVCRSARHTVRKRAEPSISIVAGYGVDGDAHAGPTVRHRYDRRRDPTRPNLRQVHLIAAELHEELRSSGFDIAPGEMGENVTTRGVDLLELPVGARLRLGGSAVVELTGLRAPCRYLDRVRPGLMRATIGPDREPRAGVMSIVVAGGVVVPGDPIVVEVGAGRADGLRPV